jgi:putative transposase
LFIILDIKQYIWYDDQEVANMSNVYHGRGYVYSIQYHIVWCVKYRHRVLNNKIETTCKELLYDIAKKYKFTIITMENDTDHIHLLIECTPQHYIPDIIKWLKGISARKLFLKHPELKKRLWGGHLWNPSYFIATVSENTESQIKEYINNQKTK